MDNSTCAACTQHAGCLMRLLHQLRPLPSSTEASVLNSVSSLLVANELDVDVATTAPAVSLANSTNASQFRRLSEDADEYLLLSARFSQMHSRYNTTLIFMLVDIINCTSSSGFVKPPNSTLD